MGIVDLCAGVTEAALRARRSDKWTRYGEGVLAAWVADMDFPVAQPVREVIRWSADHSAFGYARQEEPDEVFRAASRWMAARHGWEPDPATFVLLGDVVQGLHLATHLFSNPGDGIIVQGPIYPPFLTTITAQGRRVVNNPLVDPSGTAGLDVEALRRAAADPRTNLLLLCNPHNPTGRVFRRDELEAIAAVAVEHDLVVVADEIWMDVVFPGHRQWTFALFGPAD